ncbi:MAG: class I SAM-dependent methyltransferase, partial [Alphaproteobacteria bacterium]
MATFVQTAGFALRQGARVAWYGGHRWAGRMVATKEGAAKSAGGSAKTKSKIGRALLADAAGLLLADIANVRRGFYPPADDGDGPFARRLNLAAKFLGDINAAQARRAGGETRKVKENPEHRALPDYYLHNFHFQDGGYLSQASARIYDTQVETLFLGTANAMRRQALPAIAKYLATHDQRRARLVDIGCGTGRLLDQIGQAFPRLGMVGVDLSHTYLAQARAQLSARPIVSMVMAAGEGLPLGDASCDIAVSSFLFHELPAPIRRAVALEIGRVLVPGGLFVFIDSLQTGDRPVFDKML